MPKMIKNNKENEEKNVVKNIAKKQTGITLIALVITIVLNCCEAAMERMLKIEKIIEKRANFLYNNYVT
ncbi:MAG: hypothetical protein V8R81_02120 [Clostridia bacterium]